MTLKEQHLEAITKLNPQFYNYVVAQNKRIAAISEAITIEHMGKFAEWLDADGFEQINGGLWINIRDYKIPADKDFTTSELIALYFESLNPKP